MSHRSSDGGVYGWNPEAQVEVCGSASPDAATDRSSVPPSDSQLLAQLCRREEAALGALYDRYATRIYTLALRITGDRAGAEAVMHEVFQIVWQAPSSCVSGSSVSAWLFAITRQRALAAQHCSGGQCRAQLAPPDEVLGVGDDQVAAQTLDAALQALPAGQRTVIALAYYGGLSRIEMAARLSQSVTTIAAWLRQGLITLSVQLRNDAEKSR